MVLFQNCVWQTLSHQDGRHSAVALLLKAALIQVSDYRLLGASGLLRPTDGRARVWCQRNTSFQDNHILGTTAFGGGGVTVLGCFSFDCKLDLYVLDGNLTGQKYCDNVLAPRVVPPFRQLCIG